MSNSSHCLSQACIKSPWDQTLSQLIHYKLWKIHTQDVDEKIHIHQWQWSRAESQHLILGSISSGSLLISTPQG